MPSAKDHIAKADHDRNFLDAILADDDYLDWAAAVAFYVGVHRIEAVFALDNIHCQDHGRRNAILKSNDYRHLWKHYRPLWNASMVARYLVDSDGSKTIKFSEYMRPQDVRTKLVGHHLHQLEKSVEKRIDKAASK